MTKTTYLKVLLQKVFEVMTRSGPARLIVSSHGIPHVLGDSWPIDSQRHLMSLSSLQGHIWPFVGKPLNKLFSITITCCCLSVSYRCLFLVFLLTITRNGDISSVTFLDDFESCFHPNTSSKFVNLLGKHS